MQKRTVYILNVFILSLLFVVCSSLSVQAVENVDSFASCVNGNEDSIECFLAQYFGEELDYRLSKDDEYTYFEATVIDGKYVELWWKEDPTNSSWCPNPYDNSIRCQVARAIGERVVYSLHREEIFHDKVTVSINGKPTTIWLLNNPEEDLENNVFGVTHVSTCEQDIIGSSTACQVAQSIGSDINYSMIRNIPNGYTSEVEVSINGQPTINLYWRCRWHFYCMPNCKSYW